MHGTATAAGRPGAGNGLGGGPVPGGVGLRFESPLRTESAPPVPLPVLPSVLEALGGVDRARAALRDVVADLADRMGFSELAEQVRGLPASDRERDDVDGTVRLGLVGVKHELERCIAALATIRTAL